MAFYFALFNVSNVNQELRGHRKAQKRRRHSLATSSSSHVAKDYRLLPRPKIILHDPNTDNETVSTIVDEEDELSSGHDSFKYLNPKDSIKGRRASSPESRHAMDIAFNEPFTVAEIERQLRRVKFNSPSSRTEHTSRASASNWTENPPVEEQVWVKRALSPPNSTQHILNDDPWVYSIDLEKKKRNENASRPPLPERQRPTMGVSALELRNLGAPTAEQIRLRDDLRRHINTWPEIRTNRNRWRPTLLLRRHSGGSLIADSERLTSLFQRKRDNGNSQIPYQSITPTSPPQDPTANSAQLMKSQKPTKAPKPQKSIVVITPTSRQPPSSTTTNVRNNLNTWAQQAIIYRGNRQNSTNDSNVPFVRLNNDAPKSMIRSSVF